MNKILAIGGMPATGKTTLMKRFMKEYADDWQAVEPMKLITSHYSKSRNLFVLGKYSDEDGYAQGTDKWSMAVQPVAIEFFDKLPDGVRIVYEGDRIFNSTILHHLNAKENVDLRIFILSVGESEMHDRHKSRGDSQSEKFIKGRATKYSNISGSFDLMDVLDVVSNNTEDDQQKIMTRILDFLL